MGQYIQQYREATAGMPTAYHIIIRTDYIDKAEDAYHKIQGKIALFRTMQAQTPAKLALKEAGKVPQAISFVNDIPGIYAGGIAHLARDLMPKHTRRGARGS